MPGLVASVRLYLGSDDEIAFLEKVINFAAMPRVGELVKLTNQEMGNYFSIKIVEITHVENALPDVMLKTLPLPGSELAQYIASYVAEGWKLRSRRLKPDKPAGDRAPSPNSP